MPQLSEKAAYLLNQAAADSKRQVEHYEVQQRNIIWTNDKDVIQEDMVRRNISHTDQAMVRKVEAEWESALRKLQDAGYLERIDGHQSLTLFRQGDSSRIPARLSEQFPYLKSSKNRTKYSINYIIGH